MAHTAARHARGKGVCRFGKLCGWTTTWIACCSAWARGCGRCAGRARCVGEGRCNAKQDRIRIGRIAGIPVGISPWWLVIVVLLTWSLAASATNDFLQGGFAALSAKSNELEHRTGDSS